MDDATDSASSTTGTSDYFQKILIFDPKSISRSITVKFVTNDGKVFTQSYSAKTAIADIKVILAEVFAVPIDSMSIQQGDTAVSDKQCLNEFELGDYGTLELRLLSTKLDHTISAEDAYKDLAVPDVITVKVEDSDIEEGYRDLVVEIIDCKIDKPFLGGYLHKESGLEYHHSYSQTGPPKPKVPPENKSHRDTQTYFWRNRLMDTKYAHATQMTTNDVWIPTVTDKIIVAGPYETADEREKRLDVEGKVRTIQRYYHAWKMKKALKVLSAEYKKRMHIEQELEEFYLKDDADRKKKELISKVFPRTKDDFCMLYAMVDRWKKAEIKRICNTYSGPAKITAFYMLLDKEIQMLRAIESHRTQIKKEMKQQKDREFFKIIANPIAWNNRYKDWTNKYKDLYIEMDTLETQKGNEYKQIFVSIGDEHADVEDRVQSLLNIKLLLRDHICQLSNELVALIERACELLARGISSKHLDVLMKRIQGLLMKHIKSPECSFGVTNRMVRAKEQLMRDDLFYCSRCQKLKSHVDFAIHSRAEKLLVCLTCSWDDRVSEPWIDLAPYRYMLRLIRREERMKLSPSSIAFILQDKDVHHIVVDIWHGHSAISEVTDVYNLHLCRWFKDQDWAPWNCILLTVEEAKTHLQVKNLVEVYDAHFLCRVFNKHELAKQHFKNVLKLDDYFQGFGESDTRWNEIRKFIDFMSFGTSLRESIECWNIGTNRWLRMLVYERVTKYSTVLTYALSAIWHGFYPGYYLTFASGAIFTFAARTMRRTIRDYFTHNSELKFAYDVVTCILTRLVMAYITFTFVLLEFWPSIRLYLHMYLCLHILAVLALILVPRVVPKAVPGGSNRHATANGSIVNLHHLATNGSIAQALKQATPLTNSMSNHHD